MVPLLLLLTGCHVTEIVSNHHSDHILIAVRDIPAGTVLQRSDLKLDYGWTLHGEGTCLSLPSHVIGHKTLHPLVKGKVIRPADIEGGLNSCPENVADGWSSYEDPSHH
jgi:flagella basal body P-ring formation protein FlgA